MTNEVEEQEQYEREVMRNLVTESVDLLLDAAEVHLFWGRLEVVSAYLQHCRSQLRRAESIGL